MIYRWLILDLLRGQSKFEKNHARRFPISENWPLGTCGKSQLALVDIVWLNWSNGFVWYHRVYPKTRVWNLIFCLLKSHFFFWETSNLVGGWPTPLKNMKVSWEGLSHILWKIKNVWNHQQAILWHTHTSSPDEEITWVAWNNIK